MTPRQYFESYLTRNGGPVHVSAKLDIPYPTIAAIGNGRRGIGKDLAQRMAAADKSLDPMILVWVKRTR